jgi:hypothetical protein
MIKASAKGKKTLVKMLSSIGLILLKGKIGL